jgi:electron transfer flavoprotein beta subunit
MHVLVFLRQVYDPATIRVSSRGDLATQEGVRIVNATSLCALEEALKLKDTSHAGITVLTMGRPEAEDALHEALAMGADRAIMLCDAALDGSDDGAAACALAGAVSRAGNVDLVLAGDRSPEDDSGPIAPAVAEILGWPQITAAAGLRVAAGRAAAGQALEDGDRRISVPLPAVVTVCEHSNVPRLAPVAGIMSAYSEHTVEKWSIADIGVDANKVGTAGSSTSVQRQFAPDPWPKSDITAGTPQESARALAARLRRRGLV